MKGLSTASSVSSWNSPRAEVLLNSNEVHVWRAPLDDSSSNIASFLDTLDADERARADRFHFQKDRERFIVGRGVLRAILGLYLKSPPRCLSLQYGSHGKPTMAAESGATSIRFNMSHSNGVALYAVGRGCELGIDLEFIRRDFEADQIADRFFSASEIATLRTLPADLRQLAFFLCWTRKEAYIKARGEGLSLPLDQFDVSLIPGQPARLLSTRPDPTECSRWTLRDLTVGSDYAAALAVEGRGWSLACWQWSHLINVIA